MRASHTQPKRGANQARVTCERQQERVPPSSPPSPTNQLTHTVRVEGDASSTCTSCPQRILLWVLVCCFDGVARAVRRKTLLRSCDQEGSAIKKKSVLLIGPIIYLVWWRSGDRFFWFFTNSQEDDEKEQTKKTRSSAGNDPQRVKPIASHPLTLRYIQNYGSVATCCLAAGFQVLSCLYNARYEIFKGLFPLAWWFMFQRFKHSYKKGVLVCICIAVTILSEELGIFFNW